MYMSRIQLDPDRLEPFALSKFMGGGGYRLHQALWNLFESDPGAERDFLYRQEMANHAPGFLLLSRREPVDRDGYWQIETKPYQPQVQAGDNLAFSVRINPVVSRKDENGKQRRHDVVMDRKIANRDGREQQPQAELVQDAMEQWFASRAARSGFELLEAGLLAEGYTQHRLSRGKGEPIQFSTVDCSGHLQVTEKESFLGIAMNGLGPAKAFGCGLLLIRRL